MGQKNQYLLRSFEHKWSTPKINSENSKAISTQHRTISSRSTLTCMKMTQSTPTRDGTINNKEMMVWMLFPVRLPFRPALILHNCIEQKNLNTRQSTNTTSFEYGKYVLLKKYKTHSQKMNKKKMVIIEIKQYFQR